jgi:hypothetical protein
LSAQTICQFVAFVGLLMVAAGGFGSYYFGNLDQAATQLKLTEAQTALSAQMQKISKNLDSNFELIYRQIAVKNEVWTPVAMKNVPEGVTDYLLLLFASDRGRISGKVRVQGTDKVSQFSTTANNKIPVAVPNLWVADAHQYKMPTILEFSITEKTDTNSSLSIFTQGWIDSRGQEPH